MGAKASKNSNDKELWNVIHTMDSDLEDCHLRLPSGKHDDIVELKPGIFSVVCLKNKVVGAVATGKRKKQQHREEDSKLIKRVRMLRREHSSSHGDDEDHSYNDEASIHSHFQKQHPKQHWISIRRRSRRPPKTYGLGAAERYYFSQTNDSMESETETETTSMSISSSSLSSSASSPLSLPSIHSPLSEGRKDRKDFDGVFLKFEENHKQLLEFLL